jgi:hypothetical protein
VRSQDGSVAVGVDGQFAQDLAWQISSRPYPSEESMKLITGATTTNHKEAAIPELVAS